MAYAGRKGSPPRWRALTDMPLITLFLADLAMELALPPTLEEFQATIAMHHWSASSPIIWPKGGRQRYGICPRVSSALVTPEWMKWG